MKNVRLSVIACVIVAMGVAAPLALASQHYTANDGTHVILHQKPDGGWTITFGGEVDEVQEHEEHDTVSWWKGDKYTMFYNAESGNWWLIDTDGNVWKLTPRPPAE